LLQAVTLSTISTVFTGFYRILKGYASMRSRILLFGLALILAAFAPDRVRAATDWLVEIMPGTIHANLAADDFSVTGPNGKETLSIFSSVPNVSFGVAMGFPEGFIDAKIGGGILLNAKLGCTMLSGSAGLSLEVRPSVLFGPHAAGLYYLNPEWWGDTPIEFEDSAGLMLGIHLAAGDRIAYMLSVDYIYAAFDVKETPAGVTASDDTLDMSGVAVQFGIRAQF
jgi:hypothetical protein